MASACARVPLIAALSVVLALASGCDSGSSGEASLEPNAQIEPCACSGGGEGTRVIIGGEPSACGCTDPTGNSGANIMQDPPDPPAETSCGGETCAPYTEEETEASAKSCCTEENTCGSRAAFLFGEACIERGGDPGTRDDQCPNAQVAFVDLNGCCMPSGLCGLDVAQIPNWADIGCRDRSEMEALLNAGAAGWRSFLGEIFGLQDYIMADFGDEPISCTPASAIESE